MESLDMIIRPICWNDFSQVLTLAREFVAQLDYEDLFDEDAATGILEACAGQGLAFVLAEDTAVKGVILALMSRLPWADSAIADEVMFYTVPEVRGEGWGHRMLEALEEACRERGVSYLAMVSMASLPTDRVHSLYQQAGFEKAELLWRKAL